MTCLRPATSCQLHLNLGKNSPPPHIMKWLRAPDWLKWRSQSQSVRVNFGCVDLIVRTILYNIWILKAKACFLSYKNVKYIVQWTLEGYESLLNATGCSAASCRDNHFIVASTGEGWWEQSHIKPQYLYCNGLTVDQTLSLLILQTIDIWSPHEHNHFQRLGRSW